MPNIQMIVHEGLNDQQKERLIETLTAATVSAIDAPIDSIRVWLSEMPARNVGVAGAYSGNGLAIIQVFFIAGRSDAQKEALISALTDAAVDTIGIDRNEVRVVLNDIPNTEYGIAGKTAKSLGRGVGRLPVTHVPQ